MGVFFNRVLIKGDTKHGTHVYLDGEELKQCVSAKLELSADGFPMLTVSMVVDQVDVDLNEPVGVDSNG